MMNSYMVDWAAAGTWAQAVATLLGAVAVFYAARQGAATFELWRRQKQTERRIEAADRILTLAYEAEMAFPVVRARFMWANELDAAEAKLRSTGETFENSAPDRQSRLRTAQVFFDRLNSYQSLWNSLISVLPTAKAYFGAELAEQVRVLLKQRQAISASAEFYVDHSPGIAAQVNADLFGATEKDDDVTTAVASAIKALEAVLLPEIRTPASAPAKAAT